MIKIMKTLPALPSLSPWADRHQDVPGQIKNLVFATNSNFLISLFLLPSDVNPLDFKLKLFDLTELIF